MKGNYLAGPTATRKTSPTPVVEGKIEDIVFLQSGVWEVIIDCSITVFTEYVVQQGEVLSLICQAKGQSLDHPLAKRGRWVAVLKT